MRELIEKYLFALYVASGPAFMASVCHEATVLGKGEGEVRSRMLNTDILTESVLDELCKAFLAKARHCRYPDSDQCLTGRFYVLCFDFFWVEGNLSLAPERVFFTVTFLVILYRTGETPAIFLETNSETCIRTLEISSLKEQFHLQESILRNESEM